jgi:hypothetical protein
MRNSLEIHLFPDPGREALPAARFDIQDPRKHPIIGITTRQSENNALISVRRNARIVGIRIGGGSYPGQPGSLPKLGGRAP